MPFVIWEILLTLVGLLCLFLGLDDEAFPDASVVGAVFVAAAVILAGLMQIRDMLKELLERAGPAELPTEGR